jgi:hypothetical protein
MAVVTFVTGETLSVSRVIDRDDLLMEGRRAIFCSFRISPSAWVKLVMSSDAVVDTSRSSDEVLRIGILPRHIFVAGTVNCARQEAALPAHILAR